MLLFARDNNRTPYRLRIAKRHENTRPYKRIVTLALGIFTTFAFS